MTMTRADWAIVVVVMLWAIGIGVVMAVSGVVGALGLAYYVLLCVSWLTVFVLALRWYDVS